MGTKCHFWKDVMVAILIFSYCFGCFVYGICIYIYIYICSHIWVCRCTGVNFRCLSQSYSIFVFETVFLTEHRVYQLDSLGGQWAPQVVCLHFLSKHTHTHTHTHHIQALYECWRSKHRCLCFHSKHFTHFLIFSNAVLKPYSLAREAINLFNYSASRIP